MTRYAPLWEQAQTYAAAVDRRLIAQVSGGPYPLVTGCAVTVSTGTMNMNIAAGGVVVPTPNNTGSTLCYSDAVEVVASPTAPASGSNRIDVVVCQARGNDLDGGSNNDFLFQVVAGTVATAGSEVAPATPAGAVALAQVRVIGGAASLNAANLLDRRILQPWAEPWGLITPPVSTTGNSGSIGATTADIPGMAVTFQALANRRYRVFIQQIIQQQTAASIANLFLRTGANVQLCATGGNAPAGYFLTYTLEHYDVPGLAVVTYKAGLNTSSGTVIATATPTQPAWISAMDIGPSGAPVLQGGTMVDYIAPVALPVSSGYGPRGGGFHYGIDYSDGQAGHPIHATAAGEVVYAAYEAGGFGNTCTLQRADGLRSGYGHMQGAAIVGWGEHVAQGQVLGYVGTTGGVAGPHLHYWMGASPNPPGVIDPSPYVLGAPSAPDTGAPGAPEPEETVNDSEDDTMLIIKRGTTDVAIICGNHRPRKIPSVNDYQSGAFVVLDAPAWEQYFADAIALYEAAVGSSGRSSDDE